MTTTIDGPTGSVDDATHAAVGPPAAPAVEVVLPVYNEEVDLEPSVRRLVTYLAGHFPFSYRVTIADNASTDGTWALAGRLADELADVRAVRLPEKGRGRALHTVWQASAAEVVAYMDIDLSTDLAALLPLVAPLLSGHSDVAIGSRLARTSRVVRGARREVLSRGYNLLLRTTLRARFSDAQCGFKAMRTECARRLLPLVRDPGWFFDTELLVLAERSGCRIHEVPVDWVDDPDSRVQLTRTVLEDLRGVGRMLRALGTGALPVADLRAQFGRGPLVASVPGVPARLGRQVLRFAAVGIASTLGYLALYLLLRPSVGAQGANLVALLLTAIANTSANRRLTFGITGARHAARSQVEGLLVFGLGLLLTSGALAVLHAATDRPARLAELAVLVAANLLSTVLRFLAYRIWVFAPSRHGRPQPPDSPAGKVLSPSHDLVGPLPFAAPLPEHNGSA
jgi:putative flippase GtrA